MKINQKKFGFFAKLFICLCFISIVSVSLLGALMYFVSFRVSKKNLEAQTQRIAGQASVSLSQKLDAYKTGLSYFCADKEVISLLGRDEINRADVTELYKKMYLLMAGDSTKISMHVLKADGGFHVSTAELPLQYSMPVGRQWGVFRQLADRPEGIIYSNRFTQAGTSYAVTVAQNIMDGEKLVGYAIIDISNEIIERTLDGTRASLPVSYSLTDKNYYLFYDETAASNTIMFIDKNLRDKINESKDGITYLNDPKRLLIREQSSADFDVLLYVPMGLVELNNNFIMTAMLIVDFICVFLSLMLAQYLVPVFAKPLATLEKENRLRLAELKMLHAQINPHFLYNTLDSIKWIAKINGIDDIVLIVEKLGRLLKYSMQNQTETVRVQEEVGLLESYIAIQNIRYSGKFHVKIDIDESLLNREIPKFILQPIVENAIIHGIESKIGTAALSISGYTRDGNTIFEITDDGVGISHERLEEILVTEASPDNIGIANVSKRIKLYYGKNFGLDIISGENKGTTTKIILPELKEPMESTAKGAKKK